VKTAYLVDLGFAAAGSAVIALAAQLGVETLGGDPTTAYLMVVAAIGLSTAGSAATSRAVLSTFGSFSRISLLSVVGSVGRNGLTMALSGWGWASAVLSSALF
jgi:O-antigen/teichoic acid export membrane protein